MTDGGLPPDLAAWALSNREEARWRLQKSRAEESLLEFMQLLWPVIEPSRRFVRGWALEAMAAHLEAVTDGRIKRLVVNVPPGMAKSAMFNVFWPAWEWGPRNRPSLRYFTSSYSEQLTMRDNGKCLRLLESPIYQTLWGDRVHVDPRKSGERKFALQETGWKIASSVGGTGTGERGDRVILDDLLSASDLASDAALDAVLQYFTEVIPTRVNDDESAIVMVMQRLHERDPAGHVIANELPYDRLVLPMEYEPDHPYQIQTSIGFKDPRTEPGELLFPERFSREYLETDLKPMLRSWGGEFSVAGQLQQRPSPRGGGMFRRDDLVFCGPHEVPAGEDVRGWDLAGSKDGRAPFTVGARMRRAIVEGRPRYFVTDVVRGRWTPGEVRQQLTRAANRDGPRVTQDLPQDPGQAGLSQKGELSSLLEGFDVRFGVETGSKEDRARPLAAQAEAGNLVIVRAAWTDQLVAELTTFPAGAYKDQVDALSRAFARLVRASRPSPGAGPIVVRMTEPE